jgi:excisionase family DNA binding protein
MLTQAHESKLLTVQEVADLLGVHPMTVRKRIRRGEIPGAVQLGSKGTAVRVIAAELHAWLEAPLEAPPEAAA